MLNIFFERNKRNNNIVDVSSREDAKCWQKSINLLLNINYKISIIYHCDTKAFLITMRDYCKFISIK